MGKNRSSNITTYITESGNEVDNDGHTNEFMNTLEHHIDQWLLGEYNSTNIIYHMSEDEVYYLLNHMDSSEDNPRIPTSHLTRMEFKYHASGLKEGDVLEGNNLFRSFSRDPDSTTDILDFYYWNLDYTVDDFVIYRTVGNASFFDPSKFSNPYPDQTEAFVPMDTMRVSKIHEVTDNDELYQLTGIDQEIPYNRSVKVIDIAPDPDIKDVHVLLKSGRTTINV